MASSYVGDDRLGLRGSTGLSVRSATAMVHKATFSSHKTMLVAKKEACC